VRIDAARSFAAGSVMRLAGPAADATSGITLGGAGVDDFGRWAPGTNEAALRRSGEVAIAVPPISAALVSLAG
jgi:hypothetical protein